MAGTAEVSVRRPTWSRQAPRRVDTKLLALVVVVFALGCAGTTLAYHEAKTSTGGQHFAVFWVSQLLVLFTTLIAGTRRGVPPRWQVALLTAYGLFNFLPKLLMSPDHAVFFDEFGHWHQAQTILSTGSLSPVNTFQPIIRYFPGLELTTVGVHEITRLSIWHSGQIVVGLAHVASLLLVLGIAKRFGLSDRLAVVAALVYSLNPGFQYFDTQFAYESLGLPLALAVAYAMLRLVQSAYRKSARLWAAIAIVLAMATTVTHHISAVVAVAFCALIAISAPEPVIDGLHWTSREVRWLKWVVVVASAAAVAAWVGIVARPTLGYLSPHIFPAFSQLVHRFSGNATTTTPGSTAAPAGRHLFAGSLNPAYEKYAAFAAQPILLVCAFLGARRVLTDRSRLKHWIMPVLFSVAYFVSLPFALTTAGSEGAHRSWAFSFIGLSLMVSRGVPEFARIAQGWAHRVRLGARQMAVVGTAIGMAAVAVIGVGSVAIGEDVYYRFPGPYLFGTDTRSLTPELLQVVSWMNRHLPPRSSVITDRFSGEAVTGFTDLNVLGPHQTEATSIYHQAAAPSEDLLNYLRAYHIHYFLLDRRIETHLPIQSFFVGYRGPVSIDSTALKPKNTSPRLHVIDRSKHYLLFSIDTR